MADSKLVITEVRVTLCEDEKHDRLKAFATMTLNNAFVIRGLKIIQGTNGVFVAMPSRRRPDGQFQDIAHPINIETRREMEDIVLAEYEREVARQASQV
jgi:stage V sporulation protein G